MCLSTFFKTSYRLQIILKPTFEKFHDVILFTNQNHYKIVQNSKPKSIALPFYNDLISFSVEAWFKLKERENGRESATAKGWKGGAAGARARAPMNVLHCEPLFTHLPSRSHRRSSAGVPVPVCARV